MVDKLVHRVERLSIGWAAWLNNSILLVQKMAEVVTVNFGADRVEQSGFDHDRLRVKVGRGEASLAGIRLRAEWRRRHPLCNLQICALASVAFKITAGIEIVHTFHFLIEI